MRASDARDGRGGRGGFGSRFRGCLRSACVERFFGRGGGSAPRWCPSVSGLHIRSVGIADGG
jgi:hypothetical protein